MKSILPLLLIAGFLLTPAAFSDDNYGQPHIPSAPKTLSFSTGNWEKAINTQKQVDRWTSSASSYTKVPKAYRPTEIYQSEHSANPLSRPDSDPLAAVKQAERAAQAAQFAIPAEEESSEEQE